jgi:hypothetical protein
MYQRVGRTDSARGGTPRTSRGIAAAPGMALAGKIGNRAMARLARAQHAPRSRTLARDLTEPRDVGTGRFQMNMKTNRADGRTGLDGTISFKPGPATPDTKVIKLYQSGREVNLDTGKDVKWTGDFAARMDMETVADPKQGIEPGWAIDIYLPAAHKRTSREDPDVSPYYRDYYQNPDKSQNGSKKGKTIAEASLKDFPGSDAHDRFSFETVAVSVDTGTVYGSVQWGFTIVDPAKGTVDHEWSKGLNAPSATARQSLKNFNEYYRNKGTKNAPKNAPPPDWKP